MSYMFQDNALFDSLTVYDNIALPLRETTNLKKAEIDRRVMARIEQTAAVRGRFQICLGALRRYAKTGCAGARFDYRSSDCPF